MYSGLELLNAVSKTVFFGICICTAIEKLYNTKPVLSKIVEYYTLCRFDYNISYHSQNCRAAHVGTQASLPKESSMGPASTLGIKSATAV